PASGDEVDVAEFARLDEGADGVYRRAVEKRVPRHQDNITLFSEFDELKCLFGRGCQRLLDKDVLTCLQRRRGEREMRRYRRRDSDGVDRRIVEHGREVSGALHGRVATGDRLECRRPRIAHIDDLPVLALVKVADEIWTPVAKADNGEANRIRRRT